MNRPSFHVKKGDHVKVISGNHTGAEGKILAVLQQKEQVLIEGVRLIKKHQRKSQEHPQGIIAQREGPIHISNVKKVVQAEAKAPKKTTSKKKAT